MFNVNTQAETYTLPRLRLAGKVMRPVLVKVEQKPLDEAKKINLFHLFDSRAFSTQGLKFLSEDEQSSPLAIRIQEIYSKLKDTVKENVSSFYLHFSNQLENSNFVNNIIDIVPNLFDNNKPRGLLAEALQKALEQIQKMHGTDQKRNLVMLYSPQEQDANLPGFLPDNYTAACQALAKARVPLVTVSAEKNKASRLLKQMVKEHGCGTAAEWSVQDGARDILTEDLPGFINDLATAPNYPVLKFNKVFDKVVNLSPSPRLVKKEQDGSSKAIVGYQNKAYVLGFVEDCEFSKAKIQLRDNPDGFYSKKLAISDTEPDKTALDYLEISTKPREAALEVLNGLPADREEWKEFLAFNEFGTAAHGKILEALNRQKQKDEQKHQADLEAAAENDNAIAYKLPTSHAGEVTINGLPDNAGEETVATRDSDAPTEAKVSASQEIDENSIGLKNSIKLDLTIQDSNGNRTQTVTLNRTGLSIGRSSNSNIIVNGKTIEGDTVSRDHARIYLDNGKFLVENSSKNGTAINNGKFLKGTQEFYVSNNNTTTIHCGSAKINIKLSAEN